jgi:hypothetical protein
MNNARVKLQHKPFLTPIWLTAGVAVLAFVFALFMLFAIWTWGTANATTVIVVSEAQAQSADAEAGLSAAGEAKARLLAQIFADSKTSGGLSAIYIADTKRSNLTAQPLAQRLNITPSKLPADDVKATVSHALHDFSGGRVLVVAQPGTLPKIVSALEDDSRSVAATDANYDTLYIISVPRIGHTNLLTLRY